MLGMSAMKILVSGASIAGPALGYWLGRYGHDVTVVEKARSLRPGGQAIDFKGNTHLTVLDRMEILDEIRRYQTGKKDLHIVDDTDARIATIPGEFTGGDVEILRGDLNRLLYEHSKNLCEFKFGDSIAALEETTSGVRATFEHGDPGEWDLVIGADGIHSNVRRLAFGPEREFVEFLGYYFALVGAEREPSTRNSKRDHGLMYNVPGRLASIDSPGSPAFFVFASPELSYDLDDRDHQKSLVHRAFEDVGWRVPQYLDELPRSQDFYFDSISRVNMYPYTRGRVALVGDAGYGNTLGGFGTGLAIVGAYVLAGEIATQADHTTAFSRYNHVMRDYVNGALGSRAGSFLAPRTRKGIWMRNQLFKRSFLTRMMMRETDDRANNIDLIDYPSLVST